MPDSPKHTVYNVAPIRVGGEQQLPDPKPAKKRRGPKAVPQLRQLRTVNDLIQALEVDDALDRQDPELMQRLDHLRGLLDREFQR